MKYTRLYDKIKNPLDDEEVLEQLLQAYSEPSHFYNALTRRYSKNKQKYYSVDDSDALYASIFNKWKKEIISLTPYQCEWAIANGIYDKNIYKFIEFLKTVPDVKTKKEADAILNKNFEDKSMEDAMDKYRWDTYSLGTGWNHINKRYITGRKNITPNIEHRLYLNVPLTEIHKMSEIFMDKCNRDNLPFYFKISDTSIRDDSIVIYSNTKLLPNYLCILKEIEKEYPDLIKKCGRPPVLTGLVRNWIGYGSEPIKLSGKESFNSTRSRLITNAFYKELIEWYKKNKNANVILNGKQISLLDYISRKTTTAKIEKMNEIYDYCPQNAKYTKEEINSKDFTRRVYNLLNTKIETIFNNFLDCKNESESIEISVNSRSKTRIYSSDVIDQLRAFIVFISKNDPDFINRVRNRIKQEALKNGIDPNKYCFDIENIELLRKAEKESEMHDNQKQNQNLHLKFKNKKEHIKL